MKVTDKTLRILAIILASSTVITVIICAAVVPSTKTNMPTVIIPVVPPSISSGVSAPTKNEFLDLALALSRSDSSRPKAFEMIEKVYTSDKDGERSLITYLVELLKNNRFTDATHALTLMSRLISNEELIRAVATADGVDTSISIKLFEHLVNDELREVFDKVAIDLIDSYPYSALLLFHVSDTDQARSYLDSFTFLLNEKYDIAKDNYERYEYDERGNVVLSEVKTARGTLITKYFYENDRIAEAYPEGIGTRETFDTYEYDQSGKLTRISHKIIINGKNYTAKTENHYDHQDRLIKITYVMDGHNTENETKLYNYDSKGRLTSYRWYDYQNRVIEGTDYHYDTASDLPTGGSDVKYSRSYSLSYDSEGRLITKSEIGSGQITIYTYDVFGNLLSEKTTTSLSIDGVVTVTYDYSCVYQKKA